MRLKSWKNFAKSNNMLEMTNNMLAMRHRNFWKIQKLVRKVDKVGQADRSLYLSYSSNLSNLQTFIIFGAMKYLLVSVWGVEVSRIAKRAKNIQKAPTESVKPRTEANFWMFWRKGVSWLKGKKSHIFRVLRWFGWRGSLGEVVTWFDLGDSDALQLKYQSREKLLRFREVSHGSLGGIEGI